VCWWALWCDGWKPELDLRGLDFRDCEWIFFGIMKAGTENLKDFIEQLATGNKIQVHSSIEEPDEPNRPPISRGFSSLANILQPGGEYQNFYRF
jgi:hypothetical protein